jgi:hypothetical protein
MIRYCIYTENKNREFIESILIENLESFSIQDQIGVWKGTKEKSLKIEALGTYQDEHIKYIAGLIKVLNGQQAVLVTCERLENNWLI